METSGVYFESLKTFLLSVELKNTCISTALEISVTQNSKTHKANRCLCTRKMLPINSFGN